MKKTAFFVLVCVFTFFVTQGKAKARSYGDHAHNHLSYSIDTVLNDANGSGRIVLQVTLHVDLTSHPECTIATTSMYIPYETWDDHWILADEHSTSATITKT